MGERLRSTPQVIQETEVTPRQIDWWRERGLIHPTEQAPGSGHTCYWEPAEVAVLRVMVELVASGVAPATAALIARRLLDGVPVTLGRGLLLTYAGEC